MKNIAIIGSGQLGSRHLQALALHKEKLNIYIVDPIDKSLELSKQRYREVDRYKNKSIYTGNDISILPFEIEFAIIATTSKPRLSVLEKMLNHSTVRYLLIEKFLFPKVSEYNMALRLITNKKVKAYVNCSRRAWPVYQEIKENILADSNITITVKGSNWNLASNSIHFLDLLFYFTNNHEVKIYTSGLDSEILFNKRNGYVEFSGILRGRSQNGKLTLISNRIGSPMIEIIIESDNNKYFISEELEKIEFFQESNFKGSKDFKAMKQSELTHLIYKQLQEKNTCDLVTFEESVNHHLYLLKAFNEFLGERDGVIT